MGVEIVHDQVQWQLRRALGDQVGNEMRKIFFSSGLAELRNNVPGRDVEPGHQGLGTVANVLELAAFDAPGRHRLGRSNALKRLNSSHFVKRDRFDPRRRSRRCELVGLAHVLAFFREMLVLLGVQPVLRAMRFEVRFF